MILDEDVDALGFASNKFQITGLRRMARGEVTYFNERKENAYLTRNNKLLPTEPAPASSVPAITGASQKNPKSDFECAKIDNLFFEKTVLRRRGRPTTTMGNGSIFLPDAALSDTEYAILKEAEESHRAFEKLQRYLSSSSGTQKHAVEHSNRNQLPKRFKPNGEQDRRLQSEILRNGQDRQTLTEDDIAARNLTNELKKQDIQNILKSAGLPTDLPIYVDDGKGNYIDLDVDMAKMITEQQVKYRLVEGVFMTNNGAGSQLSNPTNVFIPEEKLKSMGIFTADETDEKNNIHISAVHEGEPPNLTYNHETSRTERKPFVVKEIIKLNQPRTKTASNLRNSLHIKRNYPCTDIVKAGND